MALDKCDRKELKQMGKKAFVAQEKKDIAQAKKAPMPKKKGGK